MCRSGDIRPARLPIRDREDPAKPPESWEDTLEWHKKLTKFDSAGNLQQFGLDPYDAMATEPDFGVLSFGGFNWWDEQNRKFRLNDPAVAQCFEMCGEFVKVIGPDKLAGLRQDSNMGGWGASYNAGVQNMIIEGYWHPGETFIQKPEIAKFNMATWAPVPASRKGAKIQSANAHFVGLFKDGKHPDEMFKIAEFLLNDIALDIIFKEVGWITGLAFSPDGRFLAGAGRDRMMRVWQMAPGDRQFKVIGVIYDKEAGNLASVAWRPDGKGLFTSDRRGHVRAPGDTGRRGAR